MISQQHLSAEAMASLGAGPPMGIRMMGAEVVDFDPERLEATVQINLNEAPSDQWVAIFLESGSSNGVDPRELTLTDRRITFSRSAEAGSIVEHAEAIRQLIDFVNVKLELELRTARQREERNRRRIEELNHAVQQRLGLSSGEVREDRA